MYDARCKRLLQDNVNMHIPWYLMSGYAYYILDDPIISDHLYDEIELFIINNRDKLKHRHLDLIPNDSDKMLSLFKKDDYPTMIYGAIANLHKAVVLAKDIRSIERLKVRANEALERMRIIMNKFDFFCEAVFENDIFYDSNEMDCALIVSEAYGEDYEG